MRFYGKSQQAASTKGRHLATRKRILQWFGAAQNRLRRSGYAVSKDPMYTWVRIEQSLLSPAGASVTASEDPRYSLQLMVLTVIDPTHNRHAQAVAALAHDLGCDRQTAATVLEACQEGGGA